MQERKRRSLEGLEQWRTGALKSLTTLADMGAVKRQGADKVRPAIDRQTSISAQAPDSWGVAWGWKVCRSALCSWGSPRPLLSFLL